MKSNDEKITSSSWLACLASGGDQSRGSVSKWRKPSCSLSTEPPSWLRSDPTCDLKYVDVWTENTDSREKHFFQCCTRRAADCAIFIFQPFFNLLWCEHEWSSKLAQKVKLVVQVCNTREIPKSLDHGRLSWNFSAKWFTWNIRTLWWPKILLFRKKGLQVRSSSRAGWGQFAQRFNSCNWPGWAAPPQPACPQLGQKRRACAMGNWTWRVRRRRPGGYGARAVRTLQDTAHMS